MVTQNPACEYECSYQGVTSAEQCHFWLNTNLRGLNVSRPCILLQRNQCHIHADMTVTVDINAETTVIANEFKDEGFTVVSLDPGDVSTGMWKYLTEDVFSETSPMVIGKKLQSRQPSQTPEQSVQSMLKLTLQLTQKDSGKFILYNGEELPW